jgi:outer membrane protein assembly factor BamE
LTGYRFASICLTLCISSVGLTACNFSLPKFKMPRVHKISVQQGNLMTQEMIDQLKPGMTHGQVAYIMGEPIFRNTFNDDRWDYVYSISVPGYFASDTRMSLFFENDSLAYFTGDLAPTEPGEESDEDSAENEGLSDEENEENEELSDEEAATS